VNTTIIELANQIQQIVPESTIEVTSSSFQDARNYMVSSAKAENVLGFAPKHNVADGIREVANVVGARRITDVNLPRFSNVAALSAQGVRS
jgi:nucleoside-diphosphate-sugar epimerase